MSRRDLRFILLASALVGLLMGLSLAIEALRARIWANELRNVGCTVPPDWSPP